MKSKARSKDDFLKLTKHVMILLIIFVISDYMIYKVLISMVNKAEEGKYGGKINSVLHRNPDILLMGSSRMNCHVNPVILDSILGKTSYNIGIDGTDIHFSLTLLKLLLSKGYKPKTVVFEISKSSFIGELHRELPTLMLYADEPVIKKELTGLSKSNYLKFLVKTYAFNSKILYILKENFLPSRKKFISGHKVKHGNNVNSDTLYVVSKPYDYIQQHIDYYIDFQTLCKNRGINLILVSSPKYFKDEHQFPEEFTRHIEEENVPLLIYSYEDNQELYKRELFFDNTHLNSTGADVFTKVLAKDIEKTYQMQNLADK